MDQVATAQVPANAAAEQPATLVAWPLRWALRVVLTAHTLAVLVQAAFAGRFMSGDFEMLRAHFVNSQVVGALGLAETALAVVYWRPGGGRGWPALACLGVSIAVPLQIASGIERVIGVHVPLALAIFATSTLLTVWSWRSTFGQRRAAAAPETT
ncbi:hypothetical protein [Virgisporangium ochraceum]|uniref:Uncharacterized protein n=1 Tax=Virgisporangium ochraceum TaxID=65505 RepID=A0A8J3ZW39_9ACTN|nr:hypothetical protein [Virgisporangium ochraceum]GIJ70711.1 hypothetical protein Voc01_056280 [Virgisporangium ochraceum]